MDRPIFKIGGTPEMEFNIEQNDLQNVLISGEIKKEWSVAEKAEPPWI
ncbi:MAG: hypothetical protein QME90_03035 [Thermodesulfobacteriota bacterium]|nr:hypothetical protein [Thermodesulfobacteriota bacterium]